MTPIAIAGILAGIGGVATIGVLRAKKQSQSLLTPEQKKIVAQPLPPPVAEKLATRGPDPSPEMINTLKIDAAAGRLNLDDILKGTNGAVFQKTSPQFNGGVVIDDENLRGIIPTDSITVDVGRAGLKVVGVPSGNMLFTVVEPVNFGSRTVKGRSADPRVPDTNETVDIPVNAITGVGPAGL